ncbi:MAG: hypothetical protein ACHQE5_09185 [Actinomycetes bacterium]
MTYWGMSLAQWERLRRVARPVSLIVWLWAGWLLLHHQSGSTLTFALLMILGAGELVVHRAERAVERLSAPTDDPGDEAVQARGWWPQALAYAAFGRRDRGD